MILTKTNLVTDDECQKLLELLEVNLKRYEIVDDPFYQWVPLSKSSKIYNSEFYQHIIQLHLDFLNSYVENRNWVIEYCGFAYQTKGFPYHADAVWPENDIDRDLGSPDFEKHTYKEYKGEWIPNYVPTRYFTTVLYLNTVDGGDTEFPTHNIKVNPESKKILGFHCDENHIHGVLPTKNGDIRKALIFWFE